MDIIEVAQARAALPRPARCKAIRQGAQLSLGDMAEALGTNAITVSRWERGVRKPSKPFIVKYVRLLGELAQVTQ
jgi:DNA-binding transcriptional regulator YiaG